MKKIIVVFCFFSLSLPSFSQTDFPLETVLQNGHTDFIQAYDFSQDGQLLATGGIDQVILLWDMTSGKQIRTFSGHAKRIRTVKFSPDQSTILSVSADNTATIFEVVTGKVIRTFRKSNCEFSSGYFSSNGDFITILDNRDGVHVWKTNSGEFVGTFEKEFSAFIEPSLIHPSENQILALNGYEGAQVVSLNTLDTLVQFPFDKVHSMSFSPNGALVAISSRKLFASVFNAETGKLLYELRDGDDLCDGCNTKHVFSPDSRFLVTMSSQVGAILWDLTTGKKIRQFFELNERPTQLLVSPQGTYILVAFDSEIFVFDLKTGKEKIHTTSEFIDYMQFAFSPDESSIVLPNENNGIDIWSVARGKVAKTFSGYLNQSDDSGIELSYSNWIDQRILSAIQSKRKVLLSPNNESIVIGNVDSVALLIELSSGKVLQTFQGHSKSVIAFDFSADGKWLATGSADRLIKIWDVATGKEIMTLEGHQQLVFDVKFNANATELISGAWDGSIYTWNLKTKNYTYLDLENSSPYCVGYSPDELYLVTANLDRDLSFWEKDVGEPFRNLVGFTNTVSEFDFSPDGKTMATSSWDGKVKIWNVLTGMLIAKMEAHQGRVLGVKYDPNGRFIASCGADNTIILWDPVSKKIVETLRGHSTAVSSIDITSDGRFLISISTDGLIKVWDLFEFKAVYSRVQLSRNEWLSTIPTGYFDGSSKALGWINYVKGNQVINVGNLFEKYYTPGLILRAWKKDPTLNDGGMLEGSDLNKLPAVSLALGAANKRSVVLDNDSVFNVNSAQLPLEISIAPHAEPLDEIRVYNNGKLIAQESLEEAISFRGAGLSKRVVMIDLANGINELTVVLVTHQRIESEPTKVLVEFDGVGSKVDLFVLTIGINTYKNPAYNLDYAMNDAVSFLNAIQVGTDSLFSEVFSYSILNEQATKANILAAIEKIKTTIGPEDVFLFYYAGHGVMSQPKTPVASEFFIVTHDVTNLYAETSVLQQKALSASELMQISMGISAEKQLFILDACHSGGAIESFALRGSEREKALAQLARNTGTFFLTASQDAEYANEVGQLNHGLFTYALLELLEGTVLLDGDQRITVNELKTYVEERVPELTQTYHGSPQYPTGYSFGRDFPIVIIK